MTFFLLLSTNTSANMFGFHEQDKYEYEYIQIDQKGQIKIQKYSG